MLVRLTLLGLLIAVSGCATAPTLGTPIARLDPASGYRFELSPNIHRRDDLLLAMSISGGGMRAAAFAHGVMRQLAAQPVRAGDRERPLLDELDAISGVSGGAVTAAYFALDPQRYFREFESRFLRRDVTAEMWRALLNPVTLIRLMSRRYSRGDLYAEVLDRRLFDGATFADLAGRQGSPYVILNATDLSVGARFEFTQQRFDALCSDLARYPVARAVAASAAAPPTVSPLSLQNFAGRCDYRPPDWMATEATVNPPTRRSIRARELLAYQRRDRYPYLHLADGSLSDDLGVRTMIDALTTVDIDPAMRSRLQTSRPRRIAMIVINSVADGGPKLARRRGAPNEMDTVTRAAQVSIDRYSAESLLALRSLLGDLARQGELSEPQDVYLIEVTPLHLEDQGERERILAVPTSLTLRPELVDAIIDAGDRLLQSSAEYQRLLRDLDGQRNAVPP